MGVSTLCPSSSRRSCWILGTFLILILHGSAAFGTDPFYTRLFEDGRFSLERGDHTSATNSLRLACFGHLDEVEALAHCLSYLAVAEAESGAEEEFLQTVQRILEVERRFRVFSKIKLDPAIQARLEEHLYEKVPYETVRDIPVFSGAARRQLEDRILGMPMKERRPRLVELLAEEPNNLSWRILMAEVDLASENFAAAVAGADQVLLRDSELLKAICIRAQARAALGDCEAALQDLYTCDERHAIEAFSVLKAECHLALGQFDQALTMARRLPRREQRRLVKEVEAGKAAAETPPAAEEQPSGQ